MEQKSQFEHQLDPELLEEIEEWEQQEHTGPEEYYFSNPDPYFKPAPLPPNHPKHNFWFDEDGHICVKNPSAFWLPEFTLPLMLCGSLSRRSTLKPLTRAAANGGRTSAFPMTLWALSRWKNC